MQATLTTLTCLSTLALHKLVDACACKQRVGKGACGERETVLGNAAVFSCADVRCVYVA